jgi:hypothetical protein
MCVSASIRACVCMRLAFSVHVCACMRECVCVHACQFCSFVCVHACCVRCVCNCACKPHLCVHASCDQDRLLNACASAPRSVASELGATRRAISLDLGVKIRGVETCYLSAMV